MKMRNALLLLALVALLIGVSVVPNATSRQGGIPSELGGTVAVNGCTCHGGDRAGRSSTLPRSGARCPSPP